MEEFFIGLASGVILNLLVTALVVRHESRSLLGALRRQALSPVRSGRASPAPAMSRGTPVELQSLDIVRALKWSSRTDGTIHGVQASEIEEVRRVARANGPAAVDRTDAMHVREVVRAALLSMGWKRASVSGAVEWLGARVEVDPVPLLVKDANTWLAEQHPVLRSA